jgi:NSS family neurotransmitter:Na+ symporter
MLVLLGGISKKGRPLKPAKELFTSRWALILAALGMAIGTGNIWRFPRIIAKTGGGAFLIPWIIALFLWSIPLLLLELAIGRKTQRGTVGAFSTLLGKDYAWMGAFIALTTTAIMFYYSVVTAWTFKYLYTSLSGGLGHITDGTIGLEFFTSFSNTLEPIFLHGLAMAITAFIVLKGVTNGIEKANKIIIPSLLVIMIISMIRALTLPGALSGLEFLFRPDWAKLLDFSTWLEALTQSAWSTGAGWGLILTYAVYMKQKRGLVLNSVITGLGNNTASLIAAMVIIPTAFAMIPAALPAAQGLSPEAQYEITVATIQQGGPASTGLAFVYLPALFNNMPAGGAFMIIFFLALAMAAVSSLIAMMELASRVLMDLGLNRKKAILTIAGTAFLLGIPSAWSMDFFVNQDWVWAIGLLVSGFFVTFAAIKFGTDRFRTELINNNSSDEGIGPWFNWVVKILLPLQFIILIGWWFSQAMTGDWWNPFAVFNIGTVIFQISLAIIFFLIVNKAMAKRSINAEVAKELHGAEGELK